MFGFCVRGVLCVGHGVSWFFANLQIGLGGGGGRASVSLARRAGGPPSAILRYNTNNFRVRNFVLKNSAINVFSLDCTSFCAKSLRETRLYFYVTTI